MTRSVRSYESWGSSDRFDAASSTADVHSESSARTCGAQEVRVCPASTNTGLGGGPHLLECVDNLLVLVVERHLREDSKGLALEMQRRNLDELDEPRSDIRLWLNALHPLELSENQPRD